MLEELEEFTEREKKFENKYVKTINELKSEAFNTENELAKVSSIRSMFPQSVLT